MPFCSCIYWRVHQAFLHPMNIEAVLSDKIIFCLVLTIHGTCSFFFQPSSRFLLLKFYSLLIPPSPLSLLCWEKKSAGKSEHTLENEGSSWYWLSWRPPISPPSTQTLNSSALHQNISLYIFSKKGEGSKSPKMFFFRLGLKESNLQIKN